MITTDHCEFTSQDDFDYGNILSIEMQEIDGSDKEDFDVETKIQPYIRKQSRSSNNLGMTIGGKDNIINQINRVDGEEFINSEEKLSIYSVTWNMFGRSANKFEIENLLKISKDTFHHIYAIGTEECMRSILTSFFFTDKSSWEKLAQAHLGPDYILLKSENMHAIHLMLFAHKSIAKQIDKIGSYSVKTGFYNISGNKGGVAIWFIYKHISFMFINCHLAAGHTCTSKRNSDFERILSNIQVGQVGNNNFNNCNKFDKKTKSSKSVSYFIDEANLISSDDYAYDVSENFNVTLFMGDFNYRIDHDIFFIDECIKHDNLKPLIMHDQMLKEIKEGRLDNSKFQEGEINFQPTYKLIPGTNKYAYGGGEKVPGWTDRILFKCLNFPHNVKNPVELYLVEYSSIKEIHLSDHRPVRAIFEIKS